MNSYELSRNWFDFCFENPEKIKPNHTAVYFFAIEHCNRLGWKEKFGFPSQMVMEAIGIKSWRTYSNTLNDLVSFGFIIMIEKSTNQYSANIIKISACAKKAKAQAKALDKALLKHGQKQHTKQGQSKASINKQGTRNKEQRTKNKEYKEIFECFRKKYKGSKLGLDTEFNNFIKKHKDWKEVLPDLLGLLTCQENINQMNKKAGAFVPQPKNLSTYINNRCWEQEIPQSEEVEKYITEKTYEFNVYEKGCKDRGIKCESTLEEWLS